MFITQFFSKPYLAAQIFYIDIDNLCDPRKNPLDPPGGYYEKYIGKLLRLLYFPPPKKAYN
jgi:hypothetical protein